MNNIQNEQVERKNAIKSYSAYTWRIFHLEILGEKVGKLAGLVFVSIQPHSRTWWAVNDKIETPKG